jgi:hypothetical protein
MDWQVLIAVVIAAPVVLLPAVFVWYVNMKGESIKVSHQLRDLSQSQVEIIPELVKERGE